MRHLALFLCLAVAVWASAASDEAAIRQQYARYQQAYKTKDIQPVMAMTAPDYTARMKDGTKLSRDDYRKTMEKQLAMGGDEKLEIHSFKLKGNQATVQTEETITVKALGSHQLQSVCDGQDTWIRTRAGWRLQHTESLNETYKMDGQTVDPTTLKKP